MFLRRTTVNSHGKFYEYIHLVESYRRKSDGRPTHRVIANLGQMSRLEFENLKNALAASNKGRRVVVATTSRSAVLPPAKPQKNLRYLDVAVVLETWRQLGLDALFRHLLDDGDTHVSLADVVAALSIQRCLDPGSKLYATRWFPRTALPELLGIAPKQFNNTRVHRVLDALDEVTPSLMRKLPRLCAKQNGAFASLFLDVSDTWFVGHGPQLAGRGKTKEGLIRTKIGIVLLCNQDGYPLRWEVVGGARSDCHVMTEMLDSVARFSWVAQTPIVMDRAMGKTAHIRDMLARNLRFVTALTRTEFGAYSSNIPHVALSDFMPSGREDTTKQDVAQAAQRAQAAGMQPLDDNLFVLDLGLVERSPEGAAEPQTAIGLKAPDEQQDLAVRAMRSCQQITDAVNDGHYSSYNAAARSLGLTTQQGKKYRQLRKLAEDIQRDIIAGKAAGHSLAALLKIARIKDSEAQRRAFAVLVKSPANKCPPQLRPTPTQRPQPIRVKAVAYFNPELFVDQRRFAWRRVKAIDAFTRNLNKRLTSTRSRRNRQRIAAEIYQRLRRDNLMEAFDVTIGQQTIDDRVCYQAEVKLKQAEWARRRRYDGFSVVVAHPDVPHSGAELCRLYRSRHIVEKDFEDIKQLVKLRPIRHRTDPKVRAHVTICMLALLLERALQSKLDGHTVNATLETLKDCHLNLYKTASEPSVYIVTECDKEQRGILRTLGLMNLADDDQIAETITPR